MGVGSGLKEAEVADGRLGEVIERLPAMQRVDAPAGAGFRVRLPVERRAPALFAQDGPAFGEPELRASIAIVVHKGEVLRAGDRARGQGERRQIDGVARSFVVETEGVRWVGLGGEANLGQSGGEGDPVERGSDAVGGGFCGEGAVGRMKRVGEQGVLDVGGDQLLVLLLVFEAKAYTTTGLDAGGGVWQGLEQARNRGVHMGAVGEDVRDGRARKAGAEGFGGHVAEGVVVGVEEPVEVGVEVGVVGEKFAEDEGLKEPGSVGQVPLGGAGLRTGLDHQVLRRERRGQGERGCSHGTVALQQRGSGLDWRLANGLGLHGPFLPGFRLEAGCCKGQEVSMRVKDRRLQEFGQVETLV